MKEIKVGHINFFSNNVWGDTGIYRIKTIINYFNKFSNKYHYEYYDCKTTACDIVFYSLYDFVENLNKCKGSPLYIFWTDEYFGVGANKIFENPFKFYKQNNLSISFFEDNLDNCYFPYGFLEYDEVINSFNNIKVNINDKIKFCTFCALNYNDREAIYRVNTVKYISEHYKEITCCGSVLNNTNGIYLPWDLDERINYHIPYKFNLCFENEKSRGTDRYITEKIMNAFIYRTIPIYWGCDKATDFFNKNAYIDCNGLSQEEILNKIIEIDNDNELYEYMINQYPFKDKSINYKEYFFERILKFVENNLIN